MILVPRPVVNDVTATSICQSYYEKVYLGHSRRQLYFFYLYNQNLILKNMCIFKDYRRLCSYIICVLERMKTAKNSQTRSWQVFSAIDFALEKLRNEIINAQTSSLRLVFQMQTTQNCKRTFNFLPNIGPISAVIEPTPLSDVHL